MAGTGRNLRQIQWNTQQFCGLKFETIEEKIPDRDHAKPWISENQLGRRNLTDDQRVDIADDAQELPVPDLRT